MKTYRITVLKGDGIGPEIMEEALKTLNAVADKYGFSFEFNYQLMGGIAIDTVGVPLPDEALAACKSSDAVLLGAVGGEKWDNLPGELRPESGLLGIRKELNLYANLRPAKIFDSLRDASPLKSDIIGENLDIMIVRELTGGIYFGEHGRDKNSAYDTEKYSAFEIERILRTAFEIAEKRQKKLTSVDKANVLETSRLWREVLLKVSKDYPDVEVSSMYVDNCAMQLIRNPKQFDVIVTSNMFGDILSDEASMISGSIGMLASASLADGKFGLYEPVHGSAPDIAGKGIANPIAMILSTAMMLRYSLNESVAADCIENAVNEVLKTARTVDVSGKDYKTVTTSEMGDLIRKLL